MTTTEQTTTIEQGEQNSLAMQLDYANISQVHATDTQNQVALCAQLNRHQVAFSATVKQPLVFRDGLLALFDVVSSDYRYIPKDRTAYTAFMQMRRSSPNQNLFNAQRQYFDWLFANDPLAYCILDPIVNVHQHGVSFEVFSRDEGCYAQLTFDHELFEQIGDINYGTTHIDFSQALVQGIEQIRSYRTTQLNIGQQAVDLQVQHPVLDEQQQIIEKRIQVPTSWIRGLLQVQSAMQISQDSFELDPVALYNVLFELRMHADIKGKKRGLLIELVPQKMPVLTLEPFDISIKSTAQVYQGSSAKLVRLWGRRRLALLKKILPHCQKVNVTLLGQGMPSYWTLSGQSFTLTLAMTGFSQANWSQALNFDLLLPKRPTGDEQNQQVNDILEQLQQTPIEFEPLKKLTKFKPTELRSMLLQLAQAGMIRYEIATGRYYYRPLTETPLDIARLTYHNLAEKHAYDLSTRANAISKFTVQVIPTQGVQLSADITVSEDRRSYHSQLQLNEEGMVSRAECSCPQFLQHRLTQGVCSHLIALRLVYAQYDCNKDKTLRYQQSRLFSKRLETSQHVHTQQFVQLTLNDKKIIIEQTGGKQAGRQQILFNTPEHAHHAYLQQIETLQARGFLENQGI